MDSEQNHSTQSKFKNESELYYDIYPSFQNKSNSFNGSKVYDKSDPNNYSGK